MFRTDDGSPRLKRPKVMNFTSNAMIGMSCCLYVLQIIYICQNINKYSRRWRVVRLWLNRRNSTPILACYSPIYYKRFMKVMYRFYDSSNSMILPRVLLKWYRFYDSSYSTILPEDCYESD